MTRSLVLEFTVPFYCKRPREAPQKSAESPYPSLNEIKRHIERLAPLHYTPLPVDRLCSLETELAYHQDILELAILPPGPSLAARWKNTLKKVVRKGLRWLLMR